MADWYKLIYYWCRRRNRYGLTIPFIIGVLDDKSIEHLLNEISNSEGTEKIILQYCGDLNEYVLSVDDINNSVANLLSGEKNLLYNDNKIESFGEFHKVIAFLEGLYAQKIAAGHFSKNMKTKEWGGYTADDNKMIKEALTFEPK